MDDSLKTNGLDAELCMIEMETSKWMICGRMTIPI